MSLYPKGTQFVIGLGYKNEWVRQVAELTAKINDQEVFFFTTIYCLFPATMLTVQKKE
jgi:hypothetical protein